MRNGTTTVTFKRENMMLVVRDVSAAVCPNCGEAYVDEATASNLLRTAQDVATAGARVDVWSSLPLPKTA